MIDLDGSHKSQQHHPHAGHYASFYPEMIVQPVTTTSESLDSATSAEFDQERQTIEKNLSKISPPTVRRFSSIDYLITTIFIDRFKILKVEVH